MSQTVGIISNDIMRSSDKSVFNSFLGLTDLSIIFKPYSTTEYFRNYHLWEHAQYGFQLSGKQNYF